MCGRLAVSDTLVPLSDSLTDGGAASVGSPHLTPRHSTSIIMRKVPWVPGVFLACLAAATPLHAQREAVEHWLITAVNMDGRDSTVRHARLRWSADTITGEIGRFEWLTGVRDGDDLRLEWVDGRRPAFRVQARRTAVGAMSGTWTAASGPQRNGVFRAVQALSADAAASLSGDASERWTISRPTFDGDSIPRHLRLRWHGDSVTGRIGPDSGVIVGTVRGGNANLLWLDNSGFVYVLAGGRTSADLLQGPAPLGGPQRGTWRARRDSPRRPPTSVVFAATGTIDQHAAHNTPALRVAAGDTVRVRAARGGAVPPILVEGAYRGDIVVVRILAVRLNPPRAVMGTALDTSWLSPTLLRRMPDEPIGRATWTLDTVARVARLDRALGRLGALTIPLRPHVGMIAVAPPGSNTMSTDEEGGHGGNLDYSALGPGVTMYLPVHHAGALLSVGGDVHAAQGDGELAHLGLESQADIDYVVEVREGGGLSWVRAEDSGHLMAFGSSEDLNTALRMAVSHLVEWLEAEYSLDRREIALLLGAAVELDIANVFGKQRTVVAKVPRRLLPEITPAPPD